MADSDDKKIDSKFTRKTLLKMTGQQRAFCRHYWQTNRAKFSAIKAGYSPHSAGAISSQLLANPKIQSELERLRRSFEERTNITKEKLLEETQFLKMRAIHGEAQYDEDGDLIAITGQDDKIAISVIQTQARILGLGGYGGQKVEVNNSIQNNYQYNLTVLSKEERAMLVGLLAKCRIEGKEKKEIGE